MAEIVRTGVFYDGSFFARVSDHYRYHHERGTRISITGLHEFVRHELDEKEKPGLCKIVEAHYFRSRFPADEAERHDALLRERRFEDALIRAGITPHFLLMAPPRVGEVETASAPVREKGIDVWLALEAYELALRKQLDVVVLVTGDGDFLQLVRKLTAIGTRTMLTAWDLQSSVDGSRTRTAQVLLDAATYPVLMNQHIDARQARNSEFDINDLFVSSGSIDLRQGIESGVVSSQERASDDRVALRQTKRTGEVGGKPAEFVDFAVGAIDNLVYDKGFGFIRHGLGGDNLFFHATDVEGCDFAELQLEEPVRFVMMSNPKDGRPAARRVSRMSPNGNR